MTLHKASDYINRLKKVSVQELLYRFKRLGRIKYLEKRFAVGANLPFKIPEMNLSFVEKLHFPTILNEDGNIKHFTIKGNTQIFENKNKKIFFSKINIHAKDPDIRAVWEPARLQSCYSKKVEDSSKLVLKWLKDNPFLFGVHYLSPMECGLRIPVFFFLLQNILKTIKNNSFEIKSPC